MRMRNAMHKLAIMYEKEKKNGGRSEERRVGKECW